MGKVVTEEIEAKTEAAEKQREKFDTLEEAKDYFGADGLQGAPTSDPEVCGPEGYWWWQVGDNMVLIKES